MIEKLNFDRIDEVEGGELKLCAMLFEIGIKLNEVISILNKISSLERLEKDLKELGEAFDKVGED